MGALDIILCRNLLIYFRDEVVRQVVARLADRLAPRGVLLVGVSESLMRFGTDLICEEHDGAFMYRKAP
jgi:chemotaxis protein methyltransferase CheR